MNKKNLIDWEKWGIENDKKWVEEKLKNTKSGSISCLESQGKYASRKEIFHAHWETYLTSSDYWKNWREKINDFQTTQEVNFYTDRLQAFIEFVEENTCKDKNNYCGTDFGDGLRQWDPETTPKLIDQELKRLENISEEEFNQTDKWRKSGPVWKELSAKEMSDDPWFREQINNIFGLENGKLPKEEEKPVEKDNDSNVDYKSWTQEQLIAEINHLKAEIKELKNNQTLTSSERQEKLQQNQQRLEKLEANITNTSSSNTDNKINDNTSTGSILAIIGVIGVAVIVSVVAIAKKLNKKVKK